MLQKPEKIETHVLGDTTDEQEEDYSLKKIDKLFRAVGGNPDSEYAPSMFMPKERLNLSSKQFDDWWQDLSLNETDSDEYRETEPDKGHAILQATRALHTLTAEEEKQLNKAHVKWLKAIAAKPQNSYAGSTELETAFNVAKVAWQRANKIPWGPPSHDWLAEHEKD